MKKLLFVCDRCDKETLIHVDEKEWIVMPKGWTILRTDKGYLDHPHTIHFCEECSKEIELP